MPWTSTESNDPNEQVQTTIARHRLTRVYWLLMAAVPLSIFALIASLLTYTIVRHESQVNAARNQKANVRAQESRENIFRVLDRINSCTTPEGECSKRGNTNGANLIAASIICTNHEPPLLTKEAALACVRDTLEAP